MIQIFFIVTIAACVIGVMVYLACNREPKRPTHISYPSYTECHLKFASEMPSSYKPINTKIYLRDTKKVVNEGCRVAATFTSPLGGSNQIVYGTFIGANFKSDPLVKRDSEGGVLICDNIIEIIKTPKKK